jgi:hypothetical protein
MPYTAKENIYVTSMGEGGKVVPADDPSAGFLLVAEGSELPDEVAERFGLTNPPKAAPAPKAPASKAK